MNGSFDVGVSVPADEDRSIEEFPQTVFDVVSEAVEADLDGDRLRVDTTEEHWPRLGTVTISRVDGETVHVRIEWEPTYYSTSTEPT